MPEVSNETLAVMLMGLTDKSNERHAENKFRLDGILEQTKITNGRLRVAETTIAQHTWAFGAIAAGLLVWLGVWLSKVL